MYEADIANLQQQIDQIRSMIPVPEYASLPMQGEDEPPYVSGDDSNIVFTPATDENGKAVIKVDVYYV